LIDESEECNEGVRFINAKTEIGHPFGARHDEGARVGIASLGNDVGQIGAHVTAKTVKLVAGYAVMVLKQFLSMTGRIAHWLNVTGFCAIRIDFCRIDDKRDTEHAEDDSLINDFPLMTPLRLLWSGYAIVNKWPRNSVS
jgi:hypothetical protein